MNQREMFPGRTVARARVVRLIESGLAYAVVPESSKLYVFQFGGIKGYKGESANEMGLLIGSFVDLVLDGDLVSGVSIVESNKLGLSPKKRDQYTAADVGA